MFFVSILKPMLHQRFFLQEKTCGTKFFFPRVAKGLVIPGIQVVGVFSLLPYSIKHVEVTVVRLNDK